MVPFGMPVVPDVKLIRQTSSAAVSQGANGSSWRAISASSAAGSPGASKQSIGGAPASTSSLGAQAVRAQHRIDAGLVDDLGQFARAQQRHGRHRDAAGLDHREDAGGHGRIVRAAQQHAVAADQAEVAPQHVGDAVDARVQLGVAQGLVFAVDARCARRRPVPAPCRAVRRRSSGAPDTAARAGRSESRAIVRAAAGARARSRPGGPRGSVLRGSRVSWSPSKGIGQTAAGRYFNSKQSQHQAYSEAWVARGPLPFLVWLTSKPSHPRRPVPMPSILIG